MQEVERGEKGGEEADRVLGLVVVVRGRSSRSSSRSSTECICSTLFQRKNWHIFHGNFLEIRAGAGGPVCFLLTSPPFLPSADTQDFFFFLHGSLLEPGRKPVDD